MSGYCGIKREQRRQALIALVADHGGNNADLRKVARIAIAMTLYSPSTSTCDIVPVLRRTWQFRDHPTRRSDDGTLSLFHRRGG